MVYISQNKKHSVPLMHGTTHYILLTPKSVAWNPRLFCLEEVCVLVLVYRLSPNICPINNKLEYDLLYSFKPNVTVLSRRKFHTLQSPHIPLFCSNKTYINNYSCYWNSLQIYFWDTLYKAKKKHTQNKKECVSRAAVTHSLLQPTRNLASKCLLALCPHDVYLTLWHWKWTFK